MLNRIAHLLLMLGAVALSACASDDEPTTVNSCQQTSDCPDGYFCNTVTQRCELSQAQPNTMTLVFDCPLRSSGEQGSTTLSANFNDVITSGAGLCQFRRTGRITTIDNLFAVSALDDDFRAVTIEALDLTQPGTYPVGDDVIDAYLEDASGEVNVGLAYTSGGQIVVTQVGDRIAGQLTATLVAPLAVGQPCRTNPARCGSVASRRSCHPDTDVCAIVCSDNLPCPQGQTCRPTSFPNFHACVAGTSGRTVGVGEACDEQTVFCEAGLRCLVGQLDAPSQGFCRADCSSPNMFCGGPEVCIEVQGSDVGACIPDPCTILSCSGQTGCEPSSFNEASCVPAGRVSGATAVSILGLGCSNCSQGSGVIPGASAWSANGNGGILRTQLDGIPVVIVEVDGTLGGNPSNPATMGIILPRWVADSGPASFSFNIPWEGLGQLVADGRVIANAISGSASFTLRDDDGASGAFDVAMEPVVR